jgi:heat shock protein HslJ
VEGIRETGDLDGDGIEESIVVLAENSGGTGVRVYLAVVGRRGGGVENLGTALVGDRVLIRSIFADQGMIQVDLVQQGPGDAACCPSEKAFRGWELGPEGLVEVFTDVSGTLSIAGLEGTEWILARLAWGDPAPTEPEVTLRVDGGRLTGAAGCNAYGAAVEEPAPGEISVGHVGRTKKLCPAPIMEIEERYLAAIGGAFSHRLLGGRLGLMYRDGERTETLIFTAR